jgi:hypothetical protein
MSFSSADASWATLAVVPYKRQKRHILTAKKQAQNKSIAVLKNTMQNEAYMTPIQYIREKGSTSSDFPSRIGSYTCKIKGDLDV